ncbi:MAG: alanine--glyoxylate aminotransferase family protein [Devosia sp.]|nr:alanine--glyoxylate aminotransferase family protein [Devosia sp.]
MTPNPAAHALLDLPPFPPERTGVLADRLGVILGTRHDVLIVQGEAIVALEAAATSLARPGLSALNIVTSPYGDWFGQWLARGGCALDNLVAEGGLPIALDRVEQALAEKSYDIVALVHAESASGILNPLPEIAALAKRANALLVVDAVASVGGHPLDVDALGVDIAVIGPQKALSGSAGLSALSVSPAAWARILAPGAPTLSALSLADLKHNWLDKGRGALPGMPSALELYALDAALTRVEAEGFQTLLARHRRAADATRAGLLALGLVPFTAPASASNLTSAAALPAGVNIADILQTLAPFATGIGPSIGAAADRVLRLNHTGLNADFAPVLANILALGAGLRQAGHKADLDAASAAVLTHYRPIPA